MNKYIFFLNKMLREFKKKLNLHLKEIGVLL